MSLATTKGYSVRWWKVNKIFYYLGHILMGIGVVLIFYRDLHDWMNAVAIATMIIGILLVGKYKAR